MTDYYAEREEGDALHGYEDEQVGAQQEGPALAYAGTSGHSGTETSRERAEQADGTGTTARRQSIVVERLHYAHRVGITVKELRERTGWHHGVASSVLTNLHIAGRIVRLEDKRDRCHVYVLPEHVNGRLRSPYVPNKRNRPEGISQQEVDRIERDAFRRGRLDGMSEFAGAQRTLNEIENYLDDREAIPTSVAWISDLRKIMKPEEER